MDTRSCAVSAAGSIYSFSFKGGCFRVRVCQLRSELCRGICGRSSSDTDEEKGSACNRTACRSGDNHAPSYDRLSYFRQRTWSGRSIERCRVHFVRMCGRQRFAAKQWKKTEKDADKTEGNIIYINFIPKIKKFFPNIIPQYVELSARSTYGKCQAVVVRRIQS